MQVRYKYLKEDHSVALTKRRMTTYKALHCYNESEKERFYMK